MISFDASVHTPETLADEITALHDLVPDARLVGSLGRSVIYGRLLGNPDHEFTFRSQNPLFVAGVARDIDVLGADVSAVGNLTPYEVDATGNSTRLLMIVRDGEDWIVTASSHGFAEAVRPEVMEPFIGEAVFGIRAVTLPPQTLVALYGLKGQIREKDEKTRDMLYETAAEHSQDGLYPDEFLRPFRQVAEMNNRSLYVRTQDAYRRIVPNQLRVRAVPLMKLVKKLAL